MILRRYGSSVQSVALNFESKALSEIGFRRDDRWSLPTDAFLSTYERTRDLEMSGSAEGFVQDEVEQELLADLEGRLRSAEAELGDGEVLLVENEVGVDYPKTRTRQKNAVVAGESRLHFTTIVDPPLRVGVYRKKGSPE